MLLSEATHTDKLYQLANDWLNEISKQLPEKYYAEQGTTQLCGTNGPEHCIDIYTKKRPDPNQTLIIEMGYHPLQICFEDCNTSDSFKDLGDKLQIAIFRPGTRSMGHREVLKDDYNLTKTIANLLTYYKLND